MPKSSKKTSKKQAKKQQKRQRPVTVHSAGYIVPREIITTLVYHYQISIAPGINTGDKVLNANSLYDPDAALGGHQPTGFDQLMQLYKYYRVMSAQFKVSAINLAQAPVVFTGFPSISLTAITSPENAPELQQAQYLHLNDGRYFRSAGGFTTPPISTDSMFKGQILDMDLVGAYNSSPAILWYYRFQCYTYNAVNTNVQLQVQITYVSKFFGSLLLQDA